VWKLLWAVGLRAWWFLFFGTAIRVVVFVCWTPRLVPFPSFEAFKQMKSPWNLGLALGCSTSSMHVTMHLLPGFVSKMAAK
jgi:hypothetical protein